MLKQRAILVVMLMSIFFMFAVQAQRASEIFIPIGKSPGVSTDTSIIGEIKAVDHQNNSITIADSSGSVSVSIKNDTQIWLDKSKIQKTNQIGTTADCKPGRLAEVKYAESERAASMTAEWIKIQVAE